MATSVYPTYRAVGRPMRFKGFQAQYIVLAALSLVADLMVFIILYIGKISPWICMALAFGLGAAALAFLAWLSRRFGSHGLMKHFAKKQLPQAIIYRNRSVCLNLFKKSI